MSERIVSAAIRVGKMTVSIPPPARHGTVMHAFGNVNRKIVAHPDDQGFLTSEGRYVGREEAMIIATAAGQLVDRIKTHPARMLFSEDLW